MSLFSILVVSTGLKHNNMVAFLSYPGVVNYAEFTSDVSWARSVAGWIMQAHIVTYIHRDTDGQSWRGRRDLPVWGFPATVSWPPWASVQCHLPSQRQSLCLVPSRSSSSAPSLWERLQWLEHQPSWGRHGGENLKDKKELCREKLTLAKLFSVWSELERRPSKSCKLNLHFFHEETDVPWREQMWLVQNHRVRKQQRA